MAALRNKLGSLFSPAMSPSSSSDHAGTTSDSRDAQNRSPRSNQKAKAEKKPRGKGVGINFVCRSKTASSSEVFGMLKALAAGGNDLDPNYDVDSDEDEEGDLALGGGQEAQSPLNSIVRPETTQTAATTATANTDSSDKDAILRQMEAETVGHTLKQQDALSTRFTALSVSNLSPYDSQVAVLPERELAALASDDDSDEEYDHPEIGDTHTHSSGSFSENEPASTGRTSPSNHAEEPKDNQGFSSDGEEITKEEKLAAVQKEFGDIAGLMEAAESERLLAECKGSLFKGIMLIGNLHLTSHRLIFHAQLPPDSVFLNHQNVAKHGDSPNNAADTPEMHESDILRAGPVTMHQRGPLKSNKRVWMELSGEMVTTYPNANDSGRVRPITCVLLSTVRTLEPLDDLKSCDFHVSYDTPIGVQESHFTIDTEQSAIQWRRAFEAALFRHARARWREREASREGLSPEDGPRPSKDQWTMMRCCVPLDRVTITGISDYHSFASLISLDVQLNEFEKVHWNFEHLRAGDMMGPDMERPAAKHTPSINDPFKRKVFSASSAQRETSSPRSGDATPPQSSIESHPTRSTTFISSTLSPRLAAAGRESQSIDNLPQEERNSYQFNLAILNEQKYFAATLQSAVSAATHVVYKQGVQRPRMVMSIAGLDCLAGDDELESGNEASFQRRSSTLDSLQQAEDGPDAPHALHKAETASMAAKVFGLKEDEGIWLKRCYVATAMVPARGHIILAPKFVCFWRRATMGADIKYRFKCDDVKGARELPSIKAGFHGMGLEVHGRHDLRFDFWSRESRDTVLVRINALCREDRPKISNARSSDLPSITSPATEEAPLIESLPRAESPKSLESDVYTAKPAEHAADILAPSRMALFESRAFPDEALSYMPFIANKPWASTSRLTPRRFTMLTIGSRGDIQPYIALGLRLLKDQHKVTIVTHNEFKKWIEGYGIEHRQAGGDPTALMKLSAEHKMFSPGFFKESLGSFRQWLDDLLLDSWSACKDADVLIESPSTMSGIHIAEALKIPYFRAFTMPWTRTNAYPQAFMVPAFEMGPGFNYSTYVLFDNIIWRATSGQINRWRKEHLHIESTDMSTLSVTKVPFLYNFSPAVVPKPLDWHDDITITGYWNLEDSDSEWTPPKELEEFMARARADGKPLGFGSIVVPRPNAMTKSICKAVEKAGVRAIIAKGWSSRGGDPATEGEHIDFPASCFGLDKVPHGWLFPKIDAALHHGGAGTVGASLRAGLPTLIKPWFGDQYFWAGRVTKLEVGLKVASLKSDDVAQALKRATSDKVMIEKAARVGERIRDENGVQAALEAIHFNIVRAAGNRSQMHWGGKTGH